MSDEVRSWFVVYHFGVRNTAPDVWVEVQAVPVGVKRAEVLERLEAWTRWPSLQSRIGILGRLRVVSSLPASGSVGRFVMPVQSAHTIVVSWEQLAPSERTLSVPLESPLYAAITRAAAAEGVSLRQWVRRVLAEVVGTDG